MNWKKYQVGFKLGKNLVHQTRYFKLENWKNTVQIDRGNTLKVALAHIIKDHKTVNTV